VGTLNNDDEEANEPEEYSIATASETSFFDQFKAMLKKKILI
jgi:hypothetical protein